MCCISSIRIVMVFITFQLMFALGSVWDWGMLMYWALMSQLPVGARVYYHTIILLMSHCYIHCDSNVRPRFFVELRIGHVILLYHIDIRK